MNDDPILDSQDARDQGLAPPALDPEALGGLWVNVGLPKILRDIAAFVFLPLIVGVIAVDVVGRYFFSHPLPANRVEQLIRDLRAKAAHERGVAPRRASRL